MRSAVHYLVHWNKNGTTDARPLLALLERQYGKRPGIAGVAVDAFRDSGLAVAVLTDEPFLNDHLAWNPDALVLTSGAPVRHNGTAIFAAELLRLCDGGPRELLAALPDIRGAFSLAAFFPQVRQLLVARDRGGLAPVYYAAERMDNPPEVVVGTAPLTTARVRGAVVPDLAFLARYIIFRYGEVSGHEAGFLRQTWLVPPAAAMDIGRDIVIRRFWSFAELDRTPWTDDQPLEEMCRQHLLNSTRQAVFSGLAAGGADKSVIALSSGLDSSSVAAACKKLGQPLPAFTARYDVESPVNEFAPAERVARNVCRDWTPVVIEPAEFLAGWQEAYALHELPLATSACLGYDILLKKIAALGYQRMVTGGSSDDLFAGNYPCYLYNLADLLVGHSPRFEREFEAWVRLHSTAEFPKNTQVFWDFLISHIDLNERGTITPRPQLMDRELVRVGCLRDAAQAAPAVRLNAGGYLHSLTAYGLWYAFRPPGLLPLVEGSWHFGIELVDPFCNEDFFQFAWKLPSDWKIRDGFNKILLRRVVGDLLPKEIAERSSKVGFDVPFLPWSRTPPFRDFIAEMLAATEAQDLEPIVDVAALRAAVTAEKPRPVSGMLLWQAVNAVMWLRMLRGG